LDGTGLLVTSPNSWDEGLGAAAVGAGAECTKFLVPPVDQDTAVGVIESHSAVQPL